MKIIIVVHSQQMRDKEIETWKESLVFDTKVRAFTSHQCGPMSEDLLWEFCLGSPGFPPSTIRSRKSGQRAYPWLCHCELLFIFYLLIYYIYPSYWPSFLTRLDLFYVKKIIHCYDEGKLFLRVLKLILSQLILQLSPRSFSVFQQESSVYCLT